jgi:hypothetical protein
VRNRSDPTQTHSYAARTYEPPGHLIASLSCGTMLLLVERSALGAVENLMTASSKQAITRVFASSWEFKPADFQRAVDDPFIRRVAD